MQPIIHVRIRRWAAWAVLGGCWTCGVVFSTEAVRGAEAAAGQKSPPAEDIEFFEKHIRPMLLEHCAECHGADSQEAGLRLDRGGPALKGGESGAAIVPKKPADSLIIKAVKFDSNKLQMPPDGKLPQDKIDLLTEWVARGAPWPAEETVEETKKSNPTTPDEIARQRASHWAFQPVRPQPAPSVKTSSWPKNVVDPFILSKLEAKGLSPAPDADRRTLLRRASYDLIGLPPSDEDFARFEADSSPDAFAREVDRLLASPHYGERWGRYWLDVARYADTKGYVFQEERRYPFAFTYRDYVIRSLNEDLPYDRFLVEQLAADKLDLGDDKRPLAALGFLTLGRRFLNNTHDIIDDRIDVVMRGTQGLTVACARCHDHKFDPIPTADYYSLYGVFASSHEPKDLPLIDLPERNAAYVKYDAELNQRQAELDAYLGEQREVLKKTLSEADQKLPNDKLDAKFERPVKNKIRELQKKIDQHRANSPAAPPRAMVMLDNPNPHEPAVFKRGNPGARGDRVKRQYLAVLTTEERKPFTQGSGRLEMAQAIASRDNPLTARVMVNRVWMNHFGQGLVDTPSDFGVRVAEPVHRALLDDLSWRFMEEGWSLKKLHRTIMLSRTYQQSSHAPAATVAADPENLLWGHANRRRLDFEALRDSLLSASGRLNEEVYGRSVDLVKTPYTTRRTVYGYVDRQNLEPLFRTFDFASPDSTSPRRFATTVPQQALFLLNNAFAVEQAEQIVASPSFHDAPSREAKIEQLWRRIYRRPATADETKLALGFLAGYDPAETPEKPTVVWQYGHGDFDENSGKTSSFTPLPHFTGSSWQGSAKLPDPTLGWVILNAQGGHPGHGPNLASIRRWTASVKGEVRLEGLLKHPQNEGDGVRGRIVSSRLGKLGEWTAHHNESRTTVDRVAVEPGDVIDFIVDCRTNESHDSYHWAPVVSLLSAADPKVASQRWDSNADFAAGGKSAAKLGPWERLAQTLLMSNEFAFVD